MRYSVLSSGERTVSYTHLALMVGAFAVTGGKILDVAPERRTQIVILQFVPDSTPSGYSTV